VGFIRRSSPDHDRTYLYYSAIDRMSTRILRRVLHHKNKNHRIYALQNDHVRRFRLRQCGDIFAFNQGYLHDNFQSKRCFFNVHLSFNVFHLPTPNMASTLATRIEERKIENILISIHPRTDVILCASSISYHQKKLL